MDKNNFHLSKNIIMNINPNFIISDIFSINLDQYFDNIWLSNLAKYLTLNNLKNLVDKLKLNLNENGKILVSYLYETTYDTKYDNFWEEIYNLEKVFTTFSEENL